MINPVSLSEFPSLNANKKRRSVLAYRSFSYVRAHRETLAVRRMIDRVNIDVYCFRKITEKNARKTHAHTRYQTDRTAVEGAIINFLAANFHAGMYPGEILLILMLRVELIYRLRHGMEFARILNKM